MFAEDTPESKTDYGIVTAVLGDKRFSVGVFWRHVARIDVGPITRVRAQVLDRKRYRCENVVRQPQLLQTRPPSCSPCRPCAQA